MRGNIKKNKIIIEVLELIFPNFKKLLYIPVRTKIIWYNIENNKIIL